MVVVVESEAVNPQYFRLALDRGLIDVPDTEPTRSYHMLAARLAPRVRLSDHAACSPPNLRATVVGRPPLSPVYIGRYVGSSVYPIILRHRLNISRFCLRPGLCYANISTNDTDRSPFIDVYSENDNSSCSHRANSRVSSSRKRRGHYRCRSQR